MECEEAYNNKNKHKCQSDYTCSMFKEILACTGHHTQNSVRNVLEYFATVPVSIITNKTRYAHAKNRV